MEKEKSTFLFPWVIFTFHGETLPYTFNFERRMHYQYLEGYELYRFHELLSYIYFWIAECKILLVTCLPTYNMEYVILVSQTFSSICTFSGFSYGSWGNKGPKEVYSNEGNTVSAVHGVSLHAEPAWAPALECAFPLSLT